MKKPSMKKTTAAAVAAAVGAALLLGGAGTLAYWQDIDGSDNQIISSGTLDLGTIASGSETWYFVDSTGAVTTTEANDIVPGDVVQMTTAVPVTLIGDNIAAELSVTRDETSAFSSDVTVSTTVGTGDAAAGTDEAVSQELTDADTTVDVVITVTFPFGTGVSNTDMSLEDASAVVKSLDFTYDYELTQVAKS